MLEEFIRRLDKIKSFILYILAQPRRISRITRVDAEGNRKWLRKVERGSEENGSGMLRLGFRYTSTKSERHEGERRSPVGKGLMLTVRRNSRLFPFSFSFSLGNFQLVARLLVMLARVWRCLNLSRRLVSRNFGERSGKWAESKGWGRSRRSDFWDLKLAPQEPGPLRIGIISQMATNIKLEKLVSMDPNGIVVHHHADIGEYLRMEDEL
ncbi:unnamed protein product [Fraxinus pennsylvanica]|uniref:Uncharacterized protein n=1 Tax=Fraxinus pennsylvanica TaxID=56036 RepID=A0AAD1ZFK5_9LAMI|nr:unnamed protein product [Fraxinus pennsylvanica]